MLHYLKSVLHWMSPQTVRSVPIAQTAWGILNDSYHGTTCLKYSAEEIAVAAIYLSMEALGVDVPYNNDARTHWWEVRDTSTSNTIPHTIPIEPFPTVEGSGIKLGQ